MKDKILKILWWIVQAGSLIIDLLKKKPDVKQ